MWCEELTHWKRSWRWERLKVGGEGMTEDEMVGWHHWLDEHEFKQTLRVGNGQGNLACCSPWDHKESDTTEQLHFTCPLSRWCHPTISSSVAPFSSCLQSFPASGSFLMSQLFTSHGQKIGVSASASVFSMNIQDWFPWGWTGWISLQYKGLSRVFSNTTVQKHQFFGAQLSSQSKSQTHTWPLEKP